jgi:transposase
MYIRAKKIPYQDKTYEYLQLVESRYEEGKNRQRVIATLGRLDELVQSGQIDRLVEGFSRFAHHLRVISLADGLSARTAKSWGPGLIFNRLWEEQGLPKILKDLFNQRQFGFDVERVIFSLALQRLCEPASDRRGAEWLQTIEAPGCGDIQLHQMYRTVNALGQMREILEKELFLKDRDLFNQEIDLVCIDTTSTYVYRTYEHEGTLRRRGYSRDKRPDLLQFVICLAVNREGWPIAWNIFPGNTADQAAFQKMVTKLRERFHVGRIMVVADQGMMNQKMLTFLTSHSSPWEYILGYRLRQNKKITQDLIEDQSSFDVLEDGLEIKEVRRDGERYVLCRNPMMALKDKEARQSIIERLQDKVSQPKSLLRNKGYARLLKMEKGAVQINEEAVNQEALYDGLYILQTNTNESPAEVVRLYKGLWRVERAFREVKSTLVARPIYHQNEESCVGHLVACFLALRLEVDLQRRLEARKVHIPWQDLMQNLNQVQSVIVDLDGERYQLRTDLRGHAHQAFAAIGLRPPNSIKHLGSSPLQPV